MSLTDECMQAIELPAVFNHTVVNTVMQQISADIENGKTLRFDASGVERTDGAAVQLLIACQCYGENFGGQADATPLLLGCSDVLKNAIANLGATNIVNIQAA